MRIDRISFLLVLTGSLFACSSSDSPADNGGAQTGNCASHNSDDLTTACDTLASTSCAYRARCTNSLIYYQSQDSCVAIAKAACLERAGLPGSGVTPGEIWLATRTYSTETCELQDVTADTSCAASGSLADGLTCAYSFQCSSGYCNLGIGTYDCGTCAALAAEGGSCGKSADCASGLWCNKGTCKQTTASGQACANSNECTEGTLCEGGKCTPTGQYTKKAGESCQVEYECVDGLACSEGKCGEPVFAAAGESCGMSATCGNGLVCKGGKCAQYVPGGACSSSSDCVMGQYCSGSKCADQGNIGEACQINGLDDDCVLGLTCVNKKCGFVNATACQ